ncbi:MAG: single-stranded-DNA-specific exonuclease RecJ [Candidatus Kerfeldbacteria bacterium]
MIKKWQIAKKISKEFQNEFPEVNPIILQLLYNRGLQTQEEIDEFLNPDYGQDIHDPFLFRDMKKAVKRIMLAIEKKQKITVHGDYDADGVSATVVIVTTLKALGAKVDVYIPHRVSEGYGLNINTVNTLNEKETNLIITVDCGISNHEEVELVNKLGMDIIITDHHKEPPVLPKSLALINPHVKGEKYPFEELAGVGVAFKLVQALVKEDDGKKIKSGFEKWLLDIVAIGTIGDCVPLVGENRTLVKYGLVVIRKSKRLGLREMVESTRFNLETLDTMNVSFGIVPKINAAGRLGHANTAYELLMTKKDAEAKKIADDLENTNKERQKITEKILSASNEQIGGVDKQKILFASGEGWQVGVVGLVAGRLSDKYARPVIIMGESKDEIVGSGRSIPGFDITKALVESSEYLERYGGHAAACGFTLKKGMKNEFISSMEKIANREISDGGVVKSFKIDREVKLNEIDWGLVNKLENFEPFGQGNKQPMFVAYNLTVKDFQKIGSTGRHLRMMVEQEGVERKIIAFGFGETLGNELSIGEKKDMLFEISINEWNGNRELQLKLVDTN